MGEQVMVIPREALEPFKKGLVLDPTETSLLLVMVDQKFRWEVRDLAEVDDSKKQIIPYLLVRCGEKWFLTRRTKKQSEARLHDKVSLGVGGHVNPDDCKDGDEPQDVEYAADDYIGGCATRELHEELEIKAEDDEIDIKLLGYVNDDSTDVSRHHLGLVFEVTVPSETTVAIRETENMVGAFADRVQIEAAIPLMENWSALVAEGYIAQPTQAD